MLESDLALQDDWLEPVNSVFLDLEIWSWLWKMTNRALKMMCSQNSQN